MRRVWRAWPVLLLAIPASVAFAAEHEVTTGVQSFSPKTLIIAPGDTVTWRNTGGGNHNVRFDDGTVNGPPATGQWTYERIFAAVDVIEYVCDIHGPTMAGTIDVREGGAPTPTPTPTPTATPTVTPDPSTTPVPDPTSTPPPPPGAATVRLDDLRVARRARRGRVRIGAAVEPEGTEVTATVRRRGRVVGRRTAAAPASGATSLVVRIDRATRKRLRRAGALRVQVTLTAGDQRLARTLRVRS